MLAMDCLPAPPDHPDVASIPPSVPVGLPHGRAWVRQTYSCTCVLCVPPTRADPTTIEPPPREEPRTELRWVKTSQGGFGAVLGPPREIWPGATVECYVPTTGRHRIVTVSVVGKIFIRDGQMLRYGYPNKPQSVRKRRARH